MPTKLKKNFNKNKIHDNEKSSRESGEIVIKFPPQPLSSRGEGKDRRGEGKGGEGRGGKTGKYRAGQ